MSDLSQIVKAYDVRGTVPDQWDERAAEALGAALTQVLNESGEPGDAVLIAHDMRATGPGLAAAFAAGVRAEGRAVIELGLASTDMLYYASGALGLPGAMFTASHNPAQYNGIKMCRSGARPIGQDSGLADIRVRAQALLDGAARPSAGPPAPVDRRNLLPDYAAHLRKLVDLSAIRPLKVVVDAGNGMGGYTVPSVLGDAALPALPLEIVPLYFELDGTFPNHEANPLDPKNLVDLQRAVVAHSADLGLAFDGDADRCFVIDERGEPVSPSAITALVAARELAKHPGSTVIHNLITSRAVPEIIREHGGEPVVARVGHSFIKAEMARTNAIFGGEHSAHYYFRDFWFADTGMLAAMHTLAALGEQSQPLSLLASVYERYVASGEINSTVTDQAARVAEVRAAYPQAEADELDGLTLRFPDGAWFNLRASNTEPLLRLNVEGPTEERMASLRDEVLERVRR
ncbi:MULTISPECIES: phosphomannomutase/phosphoglucomutase [Micromonospora]|uniref:Phosphomannomutase n=1 Tax=Micromonospora rifamycinica TaxID=291594 RepID=A0A109ILK6_9ACTN|nr:MULTISPECIES: phosphomannomutase/phosphoglucomutase [Micromonospora]KWV32805.1 phosphoglucosamine mutase [Micromonospora rifamycinica]WFE64071.1 phosphomannomutase/phosphoglucomutase [Micromonospora sp. WMMD714]SCG59723.1 phosphomannomutase [Micromonospora rifamycinica]